MATKVKCDNCGRTEEKGGKIRAVKIAKSRDNEKINLCAICRGDGRTKQVRAKNWHERLFGI